MRAPGAARLGASAQGLIDDGLDGTRATAAFGAAAEATVDLLGIPGKVFRATDRAADIVVGQDVAGTNNHENNGLFDDATSLRYWRPSRDAKGKSPISSDSKLASDDEPQSRMALKRLRHRHNCASFGLRTHD
jgi:hypothetical protein